MVEKTTASSCLKQLPMIHEDILNYNDSANHLHGINSISSLSPARFLSMQLGRCGRLPWFLCNEVLIGQKKRIEFLITKFFDTWNYHKQFHLMIFTQKHNSQNGKKNIMHVTMYVDSHLFS